MRMLNPVWLALLAAFLFGGSTPFVKLLVGELPPLVLAGLLYLGCGLGLAAIRLLRDRSWKTSGLAADEWRWFGAAIVFGGVLGPILLVFGLTRIEASAASLFLNLEAVFTAVLAWIVFKENADRRIVLGMLLIVAGGAVLAWPVSGSGTHDWIGLLAIAAACLCWGIDNNLTRRVSASDALFIAGTKGLVAGMVNTALALSLGAALPAWPAASAAMAVGFIGYGLSLVLFVMALRGLGSARTGAYFSSAPFIGAAISILLLNEHTPAPFWFAAGLMGLGVWLHLTEHHPTNIRMNRWNMHTATFTMHTTSMNMISSGTKKSRTAIFIGTRASRTNTRITRIFTIVMCIRPRLGAATCRCQNV